MKQSLLSLLLFLSTFGIAQPSRWQQHVDYTMNVQLDVESHQFDGWQKLVYTNNSPDTLKRVYYHLYLNAFQPGSMMDERSRSISDPDGRITDRISKLSDTETGKIYPTSITQDGNEVTYKVIGTILEVLLAKPILPSTSTTLNLQFEGQVPVQIRRSGRDNREGIDYSMAQWYPKLCEYDLEGWHADPYIAREFYGVWGNYDVTINLNSDYIVAATGVLQNPDEIGYGYEEPGVEVKKHKKAKQLAWHFKAENVHDFVWTADPDYVHKTVQVPDGPKVHFFYQEDSITTQSWPQLIEITPQMVSFMNKRFGKYPYSDFSLIQGGDGGMEYPMAALILGKGAFSGLVTVTLHEMFHSWYQGVLGSNETQYPWMDEGFTEYAENITKSYLSNSSSDPQSGAYRAYYYLVRSGNQEPLSTFSDYYTTNSGYNIASYYMGNLVPAILEYIVGEKTFENAFRIYFNTWKFKHPNPNDFKRVIEKETGIELGWFMNEWINTTHHVDYAVSNVASEGDSTQVRLVNLGTMPMPTEVYVTYKDGNSEIFYFPLRIMRGVKTEFGSTKATLVSDWPWTNPSKEFVIPKPLNSIRSIEINKSRRVPDINRENDKWNNQ